MRSVRFCGQCAQYVYNLSEMTQSAAEALILENEGKMCVALSIAGRTAR